MKKPKSNPGRKVPCSCPKGGLVGENERPCEKCGGTEWVEAPAGRKRVVRTTLLQRIKNLEAIVCVLAGSIEDGDISGVRQRVIDELCTTPKK